MNLRTIRIICSFVLSILFCVLIIINCDEDNAKITGPNPSGVTTSLTISPKKIQSGDKIKIVYVMRNYGPDTLSLRFGAIPQFGFEIETPDGSIVSYPNYLYWVINDLIILPGKIARYEYIFSTAGDVDARWPSHMNKLPKGRHILRAGLNEHKDQFPWLESSFYIDK